MKIFGHPVSQPARAVMWLCEANSIPYELELIDPMKVRNCRDLLFIDTNARTIHSWLTKGETRTVTVPFLTLRTCLYVLTHYLPSLNSWLLILHLPFQQWMTMGSCYTRPSPLRLVGLAFIHFWRMWVLLRQEQGQTLYVLLRCTRVTSFKLKLPPSSEQLVWILHRQAWT